MGFFSWKTSDTKRSIANKYSDRKTFPVKMLNDNEERFVETDYAGYGVFGGADYYEQVDLMNGGTGDRDRGIALAFGDKPVKLPKLVTLKCKKRWEDLPDSEVDPAQGYFYD